MQRRHLAVVAGAVVLGVALTSAAQSSPVAPGLAGEKGRLHDELEALLRGMGEVVAWRLVNSVAAASQVQETLKQNPPDVIIALPTVAVFAALLEAVVDSVDAPVVLLNLESAEAAKMTIADRLAAPGAATRRRGLMGDALASRPRSSFARYWTAAAISSFGVA